MLAIIAIIALLPALAFSKLEMDKELKGEMTFCTTQGKGACGMDLNAENDQYVAICPTWFDDPKKPLEDPACKDNICVQVHCDKCGKRLALCSKPI